MEDYLWALETLAIASLKFFWHEDAVFLGTIYDPNLGKSSRPT